MKISELEDQIGRWAMMSTVAAWHRVFDAHRDDDWYAAWMNENRGYELDDGLPYTGEKFLRIARHRAYLRRLP